MNRRPIENAKESLNNNYNIVQDKYLKSKIEEIEDEEISH